MNSVVYVFGTLFLRWILLWIYIYRYTKNAPRSHIAILSFLLLLFSSQLIYSSSKSFISIFFLVSLCRFHPFFRLLTQTSFFIQFQLILILKFLSLLVRVDFFKWFFFVICISHPFKYIPSKALSSSNMFSYVNWCIKKGPYNSCPNIWDLDLELTIVSWCM